MPRYSLKDLPAMQILQYQHSGAAYFHEGLCS